MRVGIPLTTAFPFPFRSTQFSPQSGSYAGLLQAVAVSPSSASPADSSIGDRRGDSPLTLAWGERARPPSSSARRRRPLTTWCFLQRLQRRRRRLLLSSPFWVGRCGRILAVSACGRPQLSTVARGGGGEGGGGGHERSSSAVWRGWRRPRRRQWREGARPPPPARPPILPTFPTSFFRHSRWRPQRRGNNRFWPLRRRLLRVPGLLRPQRRWHCHCPH